MQGIRAWFNWWIFGAQVAWWIFRHPASERALLMVRQGVYYTLELAHRVYLGELGEMFAYGSDGLAYVYNQRLLRAEPLAPNDLQDAAKKQTKAEAKEARRWRYEAKTFEVYEDERILFVVDGEVVTCPVSGTGVPMDVTVLSDFNRGDAIHQAYQSIHAPGLGWGNLRWLLVVVAIAVIAFVVWKYVLKGHMPGVTITTPTPFPTVTPGQTPIYGALQWALWGLTNV